MYTQILAVNLVPSNHSVIIILEVEFKKRGLRVLMVSAMESLDEWQIYCQLKKK